MKKVFISGKITGSDDYKTKFKVAQLQLERLGYTVMNPAVLPLGFEHEDYMHICYKMIDACEALVFLNDWSESKGAILEMEYARKNKKETLLYDLLMADEFMHQLLDLKSEKQADMRGDIALQDRDSVYIKDYAALLWATENIKFVGLDYARPKRGNAL